MQVDGAGRLVDLQVGADEFRRGRDRQGLSGDDERRIRLGFDFHRHRLHLGRFLMVEDEGARDCGQGEDGGCDDESEFAARVDAALQDRGDGEGDLAEEDGTVARVVDDVGRVTGAVALARVADRAGIDDVALAVLQ